MIVRRVRGVCDDTKTCPALHRTDRDTVVVQGWAVIDSDVLAQLGLPAGAEAVEVPSGRLPEPLASGPPRRQPARAPGFVPGPPVGTPGRRGQLCFPPPERPLQVPPDLPPRVF